MAILALSPSEAQLVGLTQSGWSVRRFQLRTWTSWGKDKLTHTDCEKE